MKHYEVLVGNIGKVWVGNDQAEAEIIYNRYVRFSKENRTRAASEGVTLWCDGEIIKEHDGDANADTL